MIVDKKVFYNYINHTTSPRKKYQTTIKTISVTVACIYRDCKCILVFVRCETLETGLRLGIRATVDRRRLRGAFKYSTLPADISIELCNHISEQSSAEKCRKWVISFLGQEAGERPGQLSRRALSVRNCQRPKASDKKSST